jgi:hypothetical protein
MTVEALNRMIRAVLLAGGLATASLLAAGESPVVSTAISTDNTVVR